MFSSIPSSSGFPSIFNCKIHILLLLKIDQFINCGGGEVENEEGLSRSFSYKLKVQYSGAHSFIYLCTNDVK